MTENQIIKPTRPHREKVVTLIVVVFILAAIALIALDWKQVRQVLGESNLELTFVASFLTIISYFCLSFGYVIVNRVFSIRIGWRELFEVGLVSTALNNILAFLGAAGHSLRLMLMSRREVTSGGILAASIFHSYLNNIIMLIFPVIGLTFVLLNHSLHGGTSTVFVVLDVLLVLIIIVATVMILNRTIRSWVLRVVNVLWHLITHRDITQFITELDKALDNGVTALRNNGTASIFLLVLMSAYWALAAAALWFCFYALGYAPGFGILFCGFGIGIIAGNLSLIPGGLGVQEASLAGVFALFGTPFTQAALASILFRIVYDFVPFLVSLLLYRGLIQRRNKRARQDLK
jgi:uncharacterized protein (TIRG00374 family)